MNAVHEHYKRAGKLELLGEQMEYYAKLIDGFMDKPADDFNSGQVALLNDILDELRKQLIEVTPKCKYCQAFPCQCDKIDAQRDYGREETWNRNDY